MNHFKQLITAAALGTVAISAQAELTANAGFASEYYYRGIFQTKSSASAGIDFEQKGFYAGAWTADVGDGLEYDVYGGYGLEVGDVSLSGGFTGYYYTGEFDDTYQELNFSASWKFLSVGYSVGEWDGFGTPADYNFLEVTVEHKGFHATYGDFGDDFSGEYIELGYGQEIGGFDFAITLILSDEDLSFETDDDGDPAKDEALTFSISKSFDL
jgi:uncharacterized protein (TIGR02001 family)